jgi:hypothetical protein
LGCECVNYRCLGCHSPALGRILVARFGTGMCSGTALAVSPHQKEIRISLALHSFIYSPIKVPKTLFQSMQAEISVLASLGWFHRFVTPIDVLRQNDKPQFAGIFAGFRELITQAGWVCRFVPILISTSFNLNKFQKRFLGPLTINLFVYESIHIYLCIYSSIRLFIYASMHRCVYASMLLFIYASIHLCIYSSMHLFIYSSIHLCIYASKHLFIYSYMHIFIYSSIHLFNLCINASIHLCIYSSIHLCIYKSMQLFIYASMHLFIYLRYRYRYRYRRYRYRMLPVFCTPVHYAHNAVG